MTSMIRTAETDTVEVPATIEAAMRLAGVTVSGYLPEGAELNWSNGQTGNDYQDFKEYRLKRTPPESPELMCETIDHMLSSPRKSTREEDLRSLHSVLTALKASCAEILPGVSFSGTFVPAGRPGKIDLHGIDYTPLRLRDGRVALIFMPWEHDMESFRWDTTCDQVQSWLYEHGPRYSVQQSIDALYPPDGRHWLQFAAGWDLLDSSLRRQRPSG